MIEVKRISTEIGEKTVIGKMGVVNKRLDMPEIERIRTEIGEDICLDYANGNW